METANAAGDVVAVASAQTKKSAPEPGLTRLVGAYNDKLFLAEHYMEKGWVGAAHSHPHEQIVFVISGHLKVTCGGKTFRCAIWRQLPGSWWRRTPGQRAGSYARDRYFYAVSE